MLCSVERVDEDNFYALEVELVLYTGVKQIYLNTDQLESSPFKIPNMYSKTKLEL